MPSKFSENKIFLDSSVNSLLDRLYYELETALPDKTLATCFCMSGRAAATLQGATAKDCDNIIFMVDSADVFEFARDQISKKLKATGVVKLQGRTILYFDNVFIEIWEWKSEDALDIELYEGINVQNIAQIESSSL